MDEKELDRIVSSEIDKLEQSFRNKPSSGHISASRGTHERQHADRRRAQAQLPAEAEDFVVEVVAWLRPRADRDLILSRIREALAGAVAGAAMEDDSAAGAEAPAADEAEPPEGEGSERG